MDLWVGILAIGCVAVAGLMVRAWFYRRWIANGISPTRAAAYSIGVTYLPLILLLVIASLTGGGPEGVGDWAVILGVLAVIGLSTFGLRRAVFGYMEEQGVREKVKRLQR